MSNSMLNLIIQNKNCVPFGVLQKADGGRIQHEASFNVLTILGDLLNVISYREISDYPQDNYTFKQDYIEHPFFFGKEFEGDPRFQKPMCFKTFFVAINELKEIICSNKQLSLYEFEILKQFLSLKFTFMIEFKEMNPLYRLGYREWHGTEVQKYQYCPLSYNYNFDTKMVLFEKNSAKYRFIYSCHSIEDVIFAILHYLVLFEYKFSQCSHCEKYFATKTLKQKYCTRKSPYKGQRRNKCEIAVKTIFQDFKRRKNGIYTRLYNYSDDGGDAFLEEYHRLRELARKCPTVKNLEQLNSFLIQHGGTKQPYKRKVNHYNK